jgi:hypothetical protein
VDGPLLLLEVEDILERQSPAFCESVGRRGAARRGAESDKMRARVVIFMFAVLSENVEVRTGTLKEIDNAIPQERVGLLNV